MADIYDELRNKLNQYLADNPGSENKIAAYADCSIPNLKRLAKGAMPPAGPMMLKLASDYIDAQTKRG